MTRAQIRNNFWDSLSEELKKQRRARKTQNDYNADIRTAFVDFVDYLRRDNQITEKQANSITL